MTNRDFKELLAALSAHDVRFLIVGGYAVTFRTRPRFTKDLDIWIALRWRRSGLPVA